MALLVVTHWCLLLLLLNILHLEAAQDLLATLDYGTFQGAYSSTYNISYWQKIPFAAPPVGALRFRGPQPPAPLPNGTVYNSTQTFDMCPQRTVNGSEDCLYLGLYARPWTATTAAQPPPLRPVVVVFYGGAYIEGDASFSIPPSAYPVLNVSEGTDLVFVYANYRTNAFGFLPGREIAADRNGSDLNPGLLDQDAAIKWTQKYISAFGGDPNQISIWGQSAGGGSVVAQAIARAGVPAGAQSSPRPRLSRALASSPFWVKTYDYDAPQAQAIYDSFSTLVGCGTGPGSLACLKQADVQALRNASLVVDASHTYNTSSYTWAPVIDGRFLTMRLSEASEKGLVNMDYGWGMYNTHEGQNFVPPGLADANNTGSPPFNESLASFDGWLAGYLPDFSEADLDKVKELYPEDGSSELIPSYNTTFIRAGLIFRDSVLACPGYWMAGAASKGNFLGEYSISPATHGSDTEWWDTISSVQETEPEIYKGYTGAFASFFMTGDPNAMKLTPSNVSGVPPLSSGEEFNINADGFADVTLTQFKTRCDFWKSVAAKIPI
ncbi:acetylcholinesterase precursor [Cryphonectria parasitica EP155]|uniref:Carboxylic ester hydrolase n=1 Tax=Cryphonectria parasitica (strain ATCC 38755 / EP155) TaxID=660469 RepID=A0A9P5CM23_CRYP1|nr:acetylcholinesterase precursor [Cryphonectria parasitica EP155]KAF3762425.1 acetylcholinesterase precursor [Cryphonectria parasitica EP155]